MALKAEEVLAIAIAKIRGGETVEGDMKKSVYDPDHVVQTAGGIAEYVDDEITDLQLGTASKKNSTAVVTSSTDLAESGAVYDVIGFGSTNLIDVTKYTVNGVVVTKETEGTKAVANNTSIANPAVNFRDDTSGMQEYVPVGKYILSFDVVDCEVLPSTQLAFRNSTNQIVKNVQITGVGHYEIKYTTLVPTKISLLLRVGTTGATGNEFVTFKNLTLLGSLDDRKADNSVIAPVEDGTTASQAYAVGEHFIRDGAFCTVTSAISANESLVGSSKFTSGDVGSTLSKTLSIQNMFDNGSINDLKEVGIYPIGNRTNITNLPSNAADYSVLLVLPISLEYKSNSNFRAQVIIKGVNIWTRYYSGSINNWTSWCKFTGTVVS